MFQLVYGDHELALPLAFECHVEAKLVWMLEQANQALDEKKARGELSARLTDLITSMIDGYAQPPTEKQIKYAIAIARGLAIELPADVLQFRDAMNGFLSTHADEFRRKRSRHGGVIP